MLWIAQRRGFRVGLAVRFTRVGVPENVEALCVSGHQAVLDAVVDHFDEMAGAGRTAVEIAFLGSAPGLFTSRSAVNIATTGRERFKNGIETLYDGGLAADHLTIAPLEAPDAAAGADVAIMDALGGKLLGTSDVVDVIGISAIDDDVVFFELTDQIVKRGIHHCCRNHEPDRAGLLEFLDEIVEGTRAGRAFTRKVLHCVGAEIAHNALETVLLQTPIPVGAPSSVSEHVVLHRVCSSNQMKA